MKIAIDGPGGAGKSTIARAIADDLGIFYLDTGAMYRACGLKAQRSGIDVKNPQAVEGLMENIELDVKITNEGPRLFLDGSPVGDEIRKPDVSLLASDISTNSQCRRKMTDIQRALAERYDVVMDGRDIGSVVLPNAEVKIYLTASPEERARRRMLELKQKNEAADYDAVLDELNQRDKQDSTRAIAPLKQADDAVLLITDGLTVAEVVAAVKRIIRDVTGNSAGILTEN